MNPVTLLTLIFAAWLGPDPVRSPDATDPFAITRAIPADVTAFVHLDDAASIFRTLRPQPLATAVHEGVRDDAWMIAWRGVARGLRVAPEQMFAELAGDSLTWIRRAEGEWVLITETNPVPILDYADRLGARNDGPGRRIVDRQGLALASIDGRYVLIGPKDQSDLLDDVRDRLRGRGVAADALAVAPVTQRLRTLGPGRLGYFVRTADGAFEGGVGDLLDGRLGVQHLRVDANGLLNAPAVNPQQWDESIVDLVGDAGGVIMAGPIDRRLPEWVRMIVGPDQLEAIPADIADRLGDAQVTLVGVVDEGHAGQRTSVLAAARIYEAPRGGVPVNRLDARIDTLLNDAARELNAADPTLAITLTRPAFATLERNDVRTIDIDDLVVAVGGEGHPLRGVVSANWACQPGVIDDADEQPEWIVIATHPQFLDAVTHRLGRQPRLPATLTAADQEGRIAGAGVHRLLDTLLADSDRWFGPAARNGPDAPTSVLQWASDLAATIESARWALDRVDPETVKIDFCVRLRSDSASRPDSR